MFAAPELDKLWNRWARKLSDSYVRTLRLHESGKARKASTEFEERFHVEIKKVYSEAACTAPSRFVNNKDWSAWLRRVYALSVKTKNALRKAADPNASPKTAAKARKDAAKGLHDLRKCFHTLHENTKTLRAADHLYAFREELVKKKPKADTLVKLREVLEEAAAEARCKPFLKAKAAWAKKIDPILADGKLQPKELGPARKVTDVFYRAHGERFD